MDMMQIHAIIGANHSLVLCHAHACELYILLMESLAYNHCMTNGLKATCCHGFPFVKCFDIMYVLKLYVTIGTPVFVISWIGCMCPESDIGAATANHSFSGDAGGRGLDGVMCQRCGREKLCSKQQVHATAHALEECNM